MLQAVREAVGSDAQVLAGTGSNCTAEAVEATRQAAAAGADGALVVVPYYNKPPQDGLAAHFRAIAEAAPELPLMLYNIPGRTGCSMAPDEASTAEAFGEAGGVAFFLIERFPRTARRPNEGLRPVSSSLTPLVGLG